MTAVSVSGTAREPLVSGQSDPFADWEPWRIAELERDRFNGRVGMRLISESSRVRVWSIDLPPGHRLPFHRHVLDYFWTCLSSGKARHHYEDGRIAEVEHQPGQTKHFSYEEGEHFIHDVENIGSVPLVFVTVEFLDSKNKPLPLT
jgi:hypothetical protein